MQRYGGWDNYLPKDASEEFPCTARMMVAAKIFVCVGG